MKRKNKAAAALALSACLLFTPLSAVRAANDIAGHAEETSIQTFLDKGYLKGYEDGSVMPDHSVTRAEFAALVNRVTGYHVKSPSISDYDDVPESAW